MTAHQIRSALSEALRRLGHELDAARDPETMRRLIRKRRDLQLKVEVIGGGNGRDSQ
jgi:hypothetical protein